MKPALNFCLFLTLWLALPCTLAASQRSVGSQPIDQYGVGFSLSFDYGTCSIYYANGTTSDIAKIEGSEHYKYVMRRLQAIDEISELHDPSKGCNPSFWLQKLQHNPPLPHFMRKALDRWLHQSPDVTALENMISALKVATESYLQCPVGIADLAVPMSLSPLGQRLLSSASSLAGLERTAGIQRAGVPAARANGIGRYYLPIYDDDEDWSPPQLIVTIDYSRAALTAMLWIEEVAVFELHRIQHNFHLGTDGLSKCQHSETNEDCDELVAEALRQVMKMPLEDVESDVPSRIGGLVLLGEKGMDSRLRRILQRVMAEQASARPFKPSADVENLMVDPTFAAAKGVAADSWANQYYYFSYPPRY